jgi:hypothetical protein
MRQKRSYPIYKSNKYLYLKYKKSFNVLKEMTLLLDA